MGRRLFRILAIGAAAVSLPATAAASPAPAGTAKLDPATAGFGAHLLIDAQGPDGGGFHRQEIPTALAIDVQKGFAFDPSAVAGICSDDDANNERCPPNSIVGTGTLDVLAEGYAFGPNGQQFTAQLTFYRANPRQPGDPMGVVFSFREPSSGFHGASIGRLTTVDDPILGPQLRWDQLPIPKLPPGMSFTLERLRIDIGAGTATPPQRVKPKKKRRHRCRKVIRRSRSGRRRTVFVCPKHKRKRRSTAHKAQAGALLTNPAECGSGSWLVRLEVTYKEGTEQRDANAPCQAAAAGS